MDGAVAVLQPRRGRHRRARHRRGRHARRDRAGGSQPRESIDAAGQIVMPGLINTHTHAPMVLYRGLADDLALMDWLQKYIFPGRGEDGVAGVRPRRHPAGRARDDPVGHDDLRRHVLLRGGDRPGDARGRPARRARPDDHPVSGRGCQDAGDGLARAEAFIKEFADGRPDHAGGGAARDVHARREDAAGGARARRPRRACRCSFTWPRRRTRSKTAREKYKMSPTAFLESLGVWGPRTLAAHARVADARRHPDSGAPAASACRTTPRAT